MSETQIISKFEYNEEDFTIYNDKNEIILNFSFCSGPKVNPDEAGLTILPNDIEPFIGKTIKNISFKGSSVTIRTTIGSFRITANNYKNKHMYDLECFYNNVRMICVI